MGDLLAVELREQEQLACGLVDGNDVVDVVDDLEQAVVGGIVLGEERAGRRGRLLVALLHLGQSYFLAVQEGVLWVLGVQLKVALVA